MPEKSQWDHIQDAIRRDEEVSGQLDKLNTDSSPHRRALDYELEQAEARADRALEAMKESAVRERAAALAKYQRIGFGELGFWCPHCSALVRVPEQHEDWHASPAAAGGG